MAALLPGPDSIHGSRYYCTVSSYQTNSIYLISTARIKTTHDLIDADEGVESGSKSRWPCWLSHVDCYFSSSIKTTSRKELR